MMLRFIPGKSTHQWNIYDSHRIWVTECSVKFQRVIYFSLHQRPFESRLYLMFHRSEIWNFPAMGTRDHRRHSPFILHTVPLRGLLISSSIAISEQSTTHAQSMPTPADIEFHRVWTTALVLLACFLLFRVLYTYTTASPALKVVHVLEFNLDFASYICNLR